ncbi:G-protein beta WD- 40 repeats containing protein, putative [Talaromyces stipitatus ATCC 10500]|uniref:G-protein beta WD-40 repeats containing protein, putative n=1 Tax=Talaromyces stipitatus (strain ATCC 10500 / CBS 375.48 / QM 6759 / NRRL 1006) TaxID=441959 RepID=B8MIB7_TALSN|nr:G-protein beta WD- 40 repeats containing protein, putative [Talaromyces stipitatus ATCC 10500]EED14601.1 G-protein beta WD- 40 repeats containing protein, putative [Talaromyces stipitatus ATCC 10500]
MVSRLEITMVLSRLNFIFRGAAYTTEDIDRFCLRDLRCPDSLVVKNRLKENKDKLLSQSIEWILQDPQYETWRNGDDVSLLWIKGGAGKGKTMMSIGLIEELTRAQHESTVVTYFFCQNADYELNTLEAIIKGLILQLVNQQIVLKESLRSRWDTVNNCFNEDVTSWRTLWNILLEMLDRCNCSRVYMIIDALDECEDDGMADFLKLIVRNGLDHPARIKWMLTSRPLESAERALLAGHDQVQVNLELNSKCVSEAVKTYITYKVDELSHRHRYGETLRREVETELTEKAEGTFLWVSLVCKRLESVCRDEALATIRNLPPGLDRFYEQILNQLRKGEHADVQRCMRLLKAMMLAYRPLKVEEVPSVTGLTDGEDTIIGLVNRCASFIRMRENNIEFVHQSARDYLAGEKGLSILDSHECFGHDEIVLGCLSYLSQWLKVNLIELPRPDATRECLKTLIDEKGNGLLSRVDYAATFWVQHLQNTNRTTNVQNGLTEKGQVSIFLHTKLLEWLECLSLLGRLPQAVDALKVLENISEDATRFLLRHYHTLTHWPLQVYSSAIVFSPESSVVKRENLDKIPVWLRKVPPMEDSWASLIQTLAGHSCPVLTVAFSPDGNQIASGSDDNTIKLWDATTGDLQETLTGHLGRVLTVDFSPDGKQIASGSDDDTIKLWDAATGDLQKTLAGDSRGVVTVAFSPDGKQIASGSHDDTIKLWDATTGDLQKTLADHLSSVCTIAFSPDGKQIASGSLDDTIKLWDATTGDLQKTLAGHSSAVMKVAFSPDGKQIASSSDDKTIKLWDAATGDLQKILAGHSSGVITVAFSPDGKQIASGSNDKTIKFWDAATGDLQKTLAGHSSAVVTVAFSSDGKQIASGSYDCTIKRWDATTGNLQKTLVGHSGLVQTVAFSPDGKQIASGSLDDTIKLWDATTGDLQKTLAGHSSAVMKVAFSPDGKQIASGSEDDTIKLWDAATGDLQKTLAVHSSAVVTVAFSPDGKQIASGSDDNTIKLWDATTGNLQKTLVGHSGLVQTVAFSPDGKQIASVSDDKTIKVWDIAKSLKASQYLGHTFSSHFKSRSWKEIKTSEQVYTIKFSADHRYLETDIGPIILESIPIDRQDMSLDSLRHLYVRNQWICYGGMPIIRLLSDSRPISYDVQGDQVAVGFLNGQVLSFDINRCSLQSILGSHTIASGTRQRKTYPGEHFVKAIPYLVTGRS